METKYNLNITTSGENGDNATTSISTTDANKLAELLNLAGMSQSHPVALNVSPEEEHGSCDVCGGMHEDDDHVAEGENWDNEPEATVHSPEEVLKTGDDLHKVKKSYPPVAGGDNPMALESAENKLRNMYDEFIAESEEEVEEVEEAITAKFRTKKEVPHRARKPLAKEEVEDELPRMTDDQYEELAGYIDQIDTTYADYEGKLMYYGLYSALDDGDFGEVTSKQINEYNDLVYDLDDLIEKAAKQQGVEVPTRLEDDGVRIPDDISREMETVKAKMKALFKDPSQMRIPMETNTMNMNDIKRLAGLEEQPVEEAVKKNPFADKVNWEGDEATAMPVALDALIWDLENGRGDEQVLGTYSYWFGGQWQDGDAVNEVIQDLLDQADEDGIIPDNAMRQAAVLLKGMKPKQESAELADITKLSGI